MDYKWIITVILPVITTILGAIIGILTNYFINKSKINIEEIKENKKLKVKTYNKFAEWYGTFDLSGKDFSGIEKAIYNEYLEFRKIFYENFHCLDIEIKELIIKLDNEFLNAEDDSNLQSDLKKIVLFIGEKMNYPLLDMPVVERFS